MHVKTLTCPCGAGTYTVTLRSDDWGRSDERWCMSCPACQAAYQLVTFHGDYKGTLDIRYGWVPKERCAEADRLRKQASSMVARAEELAFARYYQRWIGTLNRTTKKSLWRSITANGGRYPSLSTFYTDVKTTDLDLYLKRYFESNGPALLQELGIVDLEIEQLHRDASRLKDEVTRMVVVASFGGLGDMRKSRSVTITWMGL